MKQAYLVVFKCTDDGEEESVFATYDKSEAEGYCFAGKKPAGFEHRPGHCFVELCDDPGYETIGF